jgi:predicted transposase YbfD/YdcC
MACRLSIKEHFLNLPDPRIERSKRHQLVDILIIALCALISGADDFVSIENWGHAKKDWLTDRLGLQLPGGIPSHDTLGRVFARLDPEAFCRCFVAWTKAIKACTGGQVIALDGKELRHSFDTATGKGAIDMVSAWACKSRLVLAQKKVDPKSNEITALPQLLSLLEVAGCIVTIDAMGCQKEIAKQIIQQGGDYVLALKGNQGTLHAAVVQFFERSRAQGWRTGFGKIAHRYCQSVQKGHGRIERRRCWLVEKVGWLDPEDVWVGLASVACVECQRHIGNKFSVEVRYFISSLWGSARTVLRAVRSHWGIENRLHWVLDVQFGEDACRIRKDNAPENLAILRHLSLNLLGQERSAKVGIKTKRNRAGWDTTYLEKVLLT